MTAILGVNCFSHDTSACLVVDGEVVAMGEQERFNRHQHTKTFPDDAVGFCLGQAGIDASDLDVVAFAHHVPKDFLRGAGDAIARLAPKRLAGQIIVDGRLALRERSFRRRWGYEGRMIQVGHHHAHAASAFYASPFDHAAILTLDRGGDFLSTTLAVGQGNRIQVLDEVRNPHSLGEVYTALTWFLGFRPNADEGKVMGLAPYGTDRLVPDLRDLVRLDANGLFKVNLSWFRYQREGGPLSPRFMRRHGHPRVPESEITDRDRDLAYAVQDLLEEAGVHLARRLHERTGLPNLCVAGGVALNSVMNARMLKESGFEHIFVQPASSDAGNSMGAALWTWHQLMGKPRQWSMTHPFWGPEHQEEAMAKAFSDSGLSCRRVASPEAEAAHRLAQGKVVGWFWGRAEVGPRALGARSILADPRSIEMRDVVNARVKRREAFRPFAPAVLDERGTEYFEGYYPTPFMLLVLPVKRDRQAQIPAVTHVDGTGRVQSVSADSNPAFHRLISEFDRLTGVPVVLNTSFNLRGEPMVHRPKEAVADFLGSDMDCLFLGPLLCEKG